MMGLKGLFILLLFVSCAGPMGPFGAKNLTTAKRMSFAELSALKADKSNLSHAKVSFIPARQIFHEQRTLKIKIKDPLGIKTDHRVTFYYDGLDVTDAVNKIASKTIRKNEITYIISDLRFLPNYNNRLHVGYEHGERFGTHFYEYEYPQCIFDRFEDLKNYGKFYKKKYMIDKVVKIAKDRQMNPSLINALVAQESSFNPNAVSSAKAIGLTQITALAEKQIEDFQSDLPRYPKINKYPRRMIKNLIAAGVVNESNEWRLNPEMSTNGGVTYLRYLDNYWHKKNDLVQGVFGKENLSRVKTDLILASYNSGANRVKKALESKKHNWLQAKDLKEARTYVNNIKSYCYSFSGEGE